jgi:integrase
MSAVYFRDPLSHAYQKVSKGRPPKGAKFHVRFTDALGKRRWSQPFQTVEDANNNADGVKVASIAASKGLTVAEFENVLNAGKTTVKEAVEKFLKLHRNDRPKTVQQYTTALNHLLENCREYPFVADLATAEALDGYLDILQKEGYAKKTINTRMGIVFSLLKDYRNETGVEHASKLVSVPKPVQSRPKAYSNEELGKLFGNMTPEEHARYIFFLHTGCREQEVQYATWDDIDFKQQKFHVTGDGKRDVNFVPKNHEERWIPLTTELHGILTARRAKSKGRWIFANKDGNPEGHFLRKFKAIAKKAGMNCGLCVTTIMDGKYHLRKPTGVTCATRPVCEKHYLHRLRKTAATRWLRSGMNLMDIKTWLGHQSLAVTQIYLEDSLYIDPAMQAKLDRAAEF